MAGLVQGWPLKIGVVVGGLLGLAVLGLGSLWFVGSDEELRAGAKIENVGRLLSHATDVGPVHQPPADLMKSLSTIYDSGTLAQADYVAFSKNTVVVDGLPYYRYWLLAKKDSYAFHPSALGGYLFKVTEAENIEQAVASGRAVADVLPNGGLAWYYPQVYPVNRLKGPDVRYSALAQGSILAAFTNIYRRRGDRFKRDLARVALSLEFSYEQGGVLLGNRVFLEFPLFRSAPEVILNGWQDTLFSYADYVLITDDQRAREILENNIAAMATLLERYDKPDLRLSLYSDQSPYRVEIDTDEAAAQFRVLYRSAWSPLSDYVVPLIEIRADESVGRSPYDNQIVKRRKKGIVAMLACSRLFETIVVSDAPFELALDVGHYDDQATMPHSSESKVRLASLGDAGLNYVALGDLKDEMLCGYPTNFAKKGGKNTYHMYHIVALLYLAKTLPMKAEDRQSFIYWALRWLDYTKWHEERGRRFESPQTVLDSINSHKVLVAVQNWDELYSWAINSSKK